MLVIVFVFLISASKVHEEGTKRVVRRGMHLTGKRSSLGLFKNTLKEITFAKKTLLKKKNF